MDEQIEKAAKVLRQGGIVIFPTDTAYGIGCRMDDEVAIKKLFAIRNRPENQATPVLFNDLELIKNYVTEIAKDVKEKLIDRYWPGALTIILSCKIDKVPRLVRGESGNLGVRIPNNQTALSIIEKVGVGVLGPSANFHGGKTPFRFEELDPKLVNLVDYVVRGECRLKQTSTVIDVSQKPWKILRQGAVKINL